MEFKDNEKLIIDQIRRNNPESINELSNMVRLPWSTVQKTLDKLRQKNIIIDTSDFVKLNSEYASFAGVSVGSSRIKITILDFNFQTIKLFKIDRWYSSVVLDSFPLLKSGIQKLKDIGEFKICINQSCNSLVDFYAFITEIVDMICEIESVEKLKIRMVNFVLPGNIDYDNQVINNSYVLDKIQNIKIGNLLNQQNVKKLDSCNIKYMVDHNVIASIIGEREVGETWKKCSDEHNFMCLYLGYGIGCSYIINGQIYRGNHNAAGQIGHNQIIPRNHELNINNQVANSICRCGRVNCLEHRIREDVFAELIPEEKSEPIDLKNDDIDLIKNTLSKQPEIIRLLATYLGEALCNSVLNLSINKIILSGKLSPLFSIIENELLNILFSNGFSDIDLNESNLGEYSAAIGAAIDAYMKYYKDNFKW